MLRKPRGRLKTKTKEDLGKTLDNIRKAKEDLRT